MNHINQPYYIVYSITQVQASNQNLFDPNDIISLYSLLLNSNQVVAIEHHYSNDKLKSELRVIFWSEDSYSIWAEANKERYQTLVTRFHLAYDQKSTVFTRLTSNDNYDSEFPYTEYPNKNELIDWVLIPFYSEYFIRNFIPLGKMVNYFGAGKIEQNDELYGCRFMKERTSNIIRRPLSLPSTKNKNFPAQFIAYSFEQIMQTCMYDTPWFYRKLTALSNEVENLVDQYISDCDNSVVLVGHKTLGKELTLHTHRLDDKNRFTFTVIVRLTYTDSPLTFSCYDPIPDQDPLLPHYYSVPSLLKKYIKNKEEKEFEMGDRSSVLVFKASHTPHLVNFTNDLYLFFAYDNVTFKEGMFELVQEKSKKVLFEDIEPNKALYYFPI